LSETETILFLATSQQCFFSVSKQSEAETNSETETESRRMAVPAPQATETIA
jgi:hypothetical protein